MSRPERAWQTMTLEERETQYSPSSCLDGDLDRYLLAYPRLSTEARQQCLTVGAYLHELRYGPQTSQTVDIVTVGSGTVGSGAVGSGTVAPSPLLVFFHGGYWQELSKGDSFFAAADCIKHGVSFAAVDYTLAPNATLDEIVGECHMALTTIRSNAEPLAIDPNRIVVCGNSAGAHLAAMVSLGSADGWRPAGAGLVSGIFDLEPLVGTYINEKLALDADSANRNSPILANLSDFPKTAIVYGDNETEAFKRQSLDMAAALSNQGVETTIAEAPDRNHFDVILDLCRHDTVLGEAILRLVTQTSTD